MQDLKHLKYILLYCYLGNNGEDISLIKHKMSTSSLEVNDEHTPKIIKMKARVVP